MSLFTERRDTTRDAHRLRLFRSPKAVRVLIPFVTPELHAVVKYHLDEPFGPQLVSVKFWDDAAVSMQRVIDAWSTREVPITSDDHVLLARACARAERVGRI